VTDFELSYQLRYCEGPGLAYIGFKSSSSLSSSSSASLTEDAPEVLPIVIGCLPVPDLDLAGAAVDLGLDGPFSSADSKLCSSNDVPHWILERTTSLITPTDAEGGTHKVPDICSSSFCRFGKGSFLLLLTSWSSRLLLRGD